MPKISQTTIIGACAEALNRICAADVPWVARKKTVEVIIIALTMVISPSGDEEWQKTLDSLG